MLNKSERQRYSNALKGLKAQASAVSETLPSKPDKDALGKAQSLMSEHDSECKAIYRLVMKRGVPIPELDEALLFEWLEEPVQAL